MAKFPIDEPTDAIIQVAYAVPDIRTAIATWVEQLGVGPWFVVDRIGGPGTTYRGNPGEAEFTIAIAYSDKMMFELIEVLDDKPSIYKEARERGGYGFHHVAKIRPNVGEVAKAYEADGQAIVFHSLTPGGGEVYFVEGRDALPGYIELVEDGPAARGVFEKAWRASVEWNGDRPVRPFSELLPTN